VAPNKHRLGRQAAAAKKKAFSLSPPEGLAYARPPVIAAYFASAFGKDCGITLAARHVAKLPRQQTRDAINGLRSIASLPTALKQCLGLRYSACLADCVEPTPIDEEGWPLLTPPEQPPTAASPTVIILCASANRVCDVYKELRGVYKGYAAVSKQFSRHNKLEEAVAELREVLSHGGNPSIVVGTPSRIARLLALDAVDLARCERLVFDLEVDAKGRTAFEYADILAEIRAMWTSVVRDRVASGTLRLALF
jgi:hypothetical protein